LKDHEVEPIDRNVAKEIETYLKSVEKSSKTTKKRLSK
jgi:hypothetical protein